MSTETWLLHALQTNDSLFPTGSYAHSFGLEGLVQGGVVSDMAGCAEALRHIVAPALERVELPLVRLAYAAARAADVARLCALGELCQSVRPMRELREASLGVGRQRLAMLATLAPCGLLDELQTADDAGTFLPHGPVVTGLEFAQAGAPCEAALQACVYQAGAAWITACTKLLSVGSLAAQRALRAFLALGPDLVARSLDVAEEDLGVFSPLLEIASARHEVADARMFIS